MARRVVRRIKRYRVTVLRRVRRHGHWVVIAVSIWTTVAPVAPAPAPAPAPVAVSAPAASAPVASAASPSPAASAPVAATASPAPSASPTPTAASQAAAPTSIWSTVAREDFTTDSALGSWDALGDPNRVVYTGTSGTKWVSYPANYLDTYQKRPYRSDQVLSTHDGALDFWLHPVDGQPAGANPSPVLSSGSQYQTYGRYSARVRTDGSALGEYHVAWLLWPQSERWPADGEVDWPEAQLDGSAPQGFLHSAQLGSCSGNCVQQGSTPAGVKLSDWHTYTIEWMPNHLRLLVDDQVVLDTTQAVPSTPMRWQLQTETNGTGTDSGHLLVDWVQVDRYVG